MNKNNSFVFIPTTLMVTRIFLTMMILFPLASQADLVIANAWIKNLPPTVPVRAAYMNMSNTGQEAVCIVSFSSEKFSNIALHETIMNDGMMHMQQVTDLTIAPNQQIILEPGGMHLMMQANEPTRPGENVQMTIKLSDGSHQSLMMTVKK
jgi:hypothetical protein